MAARRPVDLPTRETADFITEHAPPGASILEIGAGSGHLAKELLRRGFDPLALDADLEAVRDAQALGVSALHASWPTDQVGPVEVVAFTRSLHHIEPLAPAVEAAAALLSPGGLLLLEDFAYESLEAQGVEWLVRKLRAPQAQALLRPPPGTLAEALLTAVDPLARARAHHDHHLHPMSALREAIERCFQVLEVQETPYLYRYLVPALPETEEGARLLELLFREEEELGGTGRLALIGRRLVARR